MKKWFKPRGKSMVLLEEKEIEKLITKKVSKKKLLKGEKNDN